MYSLMERLNIEGVPDIWDKAWALSQAIYPEDQIYFLKDDFLKEANHHLELPDEASNALLEVLALVRENPDLTRLAWLWHYLIFHSPGVQGLNSWPLPKDSMGEYSPLFPAIIMISGLPELLKHHRDLGIPEDITRDTLGDVGIWMQDYYHKHGIWGLEQVAWLVNHFKGRIYRLGRLQFMPGLFRGNIRVYRNQDEIIALSEPGVVFRRDGQVDGTNDISDLEGRWVSKFTESHDWIQGNPIMSGGYALPESVRIDKHNWEPVLSKGDPIMEVHIPAGEKMSHQLCEESFQRAGTFFPQYFPHERFHAFTCTSWLLDPNLEKLLPPQANIVRFQRRFYRYPILANGNQTFERVFGLKVKDLSLAPRETSLQRIILEHILAGGYVHSGAGFIVPGIE
jgi:hypothetical protein